MIYLLIGRRERGKTTLAYSMSRKVRKRIIIDARRMIRRIDVEVINDINDLKPALDDLVHDDVVNEIVFQPTDDDLDFVFQAWTAAVKERILKSPGTSFAIVVDEASFYPLDNARFQWLAKCTPRDQVHILITAHRPADIPTSIRAIADHWCVFATTQEHDLKVIESRMGPAVAAVRRLRDRDYAHWDDARGVLSVCNRPQDWYVSMHMGTMPEPIDVIDRSIEQDAEWELKSDE